MCIPESGIKGVSSKITRDVYRPDHSPFGRPGDPQAEGEYIEYVIVRIENQFECPGHREVIRVTPGRIKTTDSGARIEENRLGRMNPVFKPDREVHRILKRGMPRKERRFGCRTPIDPLRVERDSKRHPFQKIEGKAGVELLGHIEGGKDIRRDIEVVLNPTLVGDPEIDPKRFCIIVDTHQSSEPATEGGGCIGRILVNGLYTATA